MQRANICTAYVPLSVIQLKFEAMGLELTFVAFTLLSFSAIGILGEETRGSNISGQGQQPQEGRPIPVPCPPCHFPCDAQTMPKLAGREREIINEQMRRRRRNAPPYFRDAEAYEDADRFFGRSHPFSGKQQSDESSQDDSEVRIGNTGPDGTFESPRFLPPMISGPPFPGRTITFPGPPPSYQEFLRRPSTTGESSSGRHDSYMDLLRNIREESNSKKETR